MPGYDVVGTVAATGPGVDRALFRHRFAVVTKVGGWASHLIIEAADLVPVPDGVDSAAAETVVVNGVTAWQMLHRTARSRRAARSWCWAPTAASARRWCSSLATPESR